MTAKYSEAPKAPKNPLQPQSPLPNEWRIYFDQLTRELEDLRSRVAALE